MQLVHFCELCNKFFDDDGGECPRCLPLIDNLALTLFGWLYIQDLYKPIENVRR